MPCKKCGVEEPGSICWNCGWDQSQEYTDHVIGRWSEVGIELQLMGDSGQDIGTPLGQFSKQLVCASCGKGIYPPLTSDRVVVRTYRPSPLCIQLMLVHNHPNCLKYWKEE